MINLIIIRFYQRIDNWWTYWGWYIIVFTSVHPLTLATSHQYGGSRDIEPEGHAVSIGSSSLCLSKVPENWTYGHSRIPSHTRNIFKLWSSLINTWGFFKHILKSPNPNINTYQNHQISRLFFHFLGAQTISWWHAEGNDPHGTSAAMSSIQLSGRPAASLAAHAGAI